MNQKVDVICQNCRDGKIIPIKVRMTDEDGIMQQFVIKNYKEVAAFTDGYTMPNEVRVGGRCSQRKYECYVNVFNKLQKFYLVFNLTDVTWSLVT